MAINLINVDIANEEHQKVLENLSISTEFLGKINNYEFHTSETFYNNDYLVLNENNIIGYLGLTDIVDSCIGNTVSLYYGVLDTYYGNKFGKQIVSLVKEELEKDENIDHIIASVDSLNIHGNKVIQDSNFTSLYETTDETIYSYNLRRK